jgi:hypothetical protein
VRERGPGPVEELRGAIQEEILDELTSRAASLYHVDLARADRLIAERLGTI